MATLLGDGMHPMTPNLGQGAVLLPPCLASLLLAAGLIVYLVVQAVAARSR